MKISIFVTCVVDQLFPATGIAMATVLERAGCEIHFPEDQTCCGQPAFNTGYRDEAATVARHTMKVLQGSDYVVVPAGSCASMMCHHYTDLFAPGTDHDAAKQLAPRVVEFSKFLTDVLQVEDLGARFDGVVTYHDACHSLRELGIKDGPRRLLGKVRGLELREMDIPEECCGFGGTFSVKFPGVSGGMARTKIDSIVRTGANTLVSADSSCLMQMAGAISRAGLPIRTMHLAEVLASR